MQKQHQIDSNRFSVISRENTFNLPLRKNPLREATPNNDEKSDKSNKDLSKRNNDSSKKVSGKKDMKEKKFRQLKDVTVILDDSMIKNVKG